MDSIRQGTQQTHQLDGLHTPDSIINALSVDVEEYYHAEIFREGTKRESPSQHQGRVEANVERILRLLADRDTLATFFVLGEIAVLYPAMVKKIAAAGHEVACHSYRHELVSGQSREEFRTDVGRAKAVLEDLVGEPVIGYRAPNFSIGPSQAWAFDILLEQGFRYDSSIYPILHDRYGQPNAPRFAYAIRGDETGGLIEFPIGTARFLGVNLPIGGGGWFRLLPMPLVRRGIRRVNTTEGKGVMFYFHPWELDVDQPKPAMPWRHHFRLYVGLARMEAKIACLLRDLRFSSIREILSSQMCRGCLGLTAP